MQTLVNQNQTRAPMFAVKLTSSGGQLTIGGVDRTLYTGSFTFSSVIERAYWRIRMNGIVVNGRQVVTQRAAIVDTGCTYIIGSVAAVHALYSAMPGARESGAMGNGYWTGMFMLISVIITDA
jgi:hypothetical protein